MGCFGCLGFIIGIFFLFRGITGIFTGVHYIPCFTDLIMGMILVTPINAYFESVFEYSLSTGKKILIIIVCLALQSSFTATAIYNDFSKNFPGILALVQSDNITDKDVIRTSEYQKVAFKKFMAELKEASDNCLNSSTYSELSCVQSYYRVSRVGIPDELPYKVRVILTDIKKDCYMYSIKSRKFGETSIRPEDKFKYQLDKLNNFAFEQVLLRRANKFMGIIPANSFLPENI